MKSDKRRPYVTRDTILKFLSDDEVSAVSNAESAAHLTEGEEYVDLGELERGVLRATKEDINIARALPKKSVRAETWRKIMSQLGPVKNP